MKKIKAVVKTAIDQAKAHPLVAPRTVDNAQCIVNSRLNGRVAHKVQWTNWLSRPNDTN